jgi:cell division protein FtsB
MAVRRKGGTTGPTKKGRPNGNPASPGVRRNRIPVALAAVIAVVILGTSFPLSALFSQHGQLSSTSAQLQKVQSENGLLAEQQHQLNSTTDVDRLARQDYQMVMPGQTLYDVLPPSGLAAATAGQATPGDPGSQPLVSPTNAPDMTPDPNLPSASASSGGSATPGASGASGNAGGGGSGAGSGSAASASTGVASQNRGSGSSASEVPSAPSSFWSRVTNTLEFWK